MEHDKANNVIKFIVKEKNTSDLVLTAFFDVKESTIEVIPGDPKYKVTGVKMKVSNVEITNLLKEKGEGVTLTDALVKGAPIMDIPASQFLHTNQADEAYVRVGDKSRKLTFDERMQLMYDKGERFYEDTAVYGATIDDIDMDAVAEL